MVISRDHQVRFFQTTAVPFDSLQQVGETFSVPDLRLASQWRLDLPTPTSLPEYDQPVRQILGVAEKILNRGFATSVQHDIEKKLCSTFSLEANVSLKDLLLYPIAENRSCPQLDTDQEKEFYSKHLPEFLGADFGVQRL